MRPLTRVGLALVITLGLMSASGRSAAGPAPVPPPAPRIEALTHGVRGPLRAGDRITVSLRGTGRGSATLHIFGVVTDVGMRELRTAAYASTPALYMGTYVIRPGDAIRNAAVFATLTVGGQEITAVSGRPVTIDTRPPVVSSRYPAPQSRLTNLRPNIVVHYDDNVSGVRPGAVRLLVNGQDVSARTSISETSAAYNAETPFRPGPVRAQLLVADRTGNSMPTEWVFTILPPVGVIQSVTINPATPLGAGDILTVVMAGPPGGRATFAIAGLPAVAMRESRTPGLYFGTYAVAPGQTVLGAALTVTLEWGGGRETAVAAAPVTLLGTPPPAPTLLSPGGAAVVGAGTGSRLVLRGRSRPGFRIVGRIALAARTSAEAPQLLGEFSTVAGPDGTWRVTLGPMIPNEGGKLLGTVLAIDPANQRSVPAVFEVSQ